MSLWIIRLGCNEVVFAVWHAFEVCLVEVCDCLLFLFNVCSAAIAPLLANACHPLVTSAEQCLHMRSICPAWQGKQTRTRHKNCETAVTGCYIICSATSATKTTQACLHACQVLRHPTETITPGSCMLFIDNLMCKVVISCSSAQAVQTLYQSCDLLTVMPQYHPLLRRTLLCMYICTQQPANEPHSMWPMSHITSVVYSIKQRYNDNCRVFNSRRLPTGPILICYYNRKQGTAGAQKLPAAATVRHSPANKSTSSYPRC